jgi:hypothetical protein
VLAALPAGFFGVLFGLRVNTSSEVAVTIADREYHIERRNLAAAIYLNAGMA